MNYASTPRLTQVSRLLTAGDACTPNVDLVSRGDMFEPKKCGDLVVDLTTAQRLIENGQYVRAAFCLGTIEREYGANDAGLANGIRCALSALDRMDYDHAVAVLDVCHELCRPRFSERAPVERLRLVAGWLSDD